MTQGDTLAVFKWLKRESSGFYISPSVLHAVLAGAFQLSIRKTFQWEWFQNAMACISKMPGSCQPLRFLSSLTPLKKKKSEVANTQVFLTFGALKVNGRFYYSGL